MKATMHFLLAIIGIMLWVFVMAGCSGIGDSAMSAGSDGDGDMDGDADGDWDNDWPPDDDPEEDTDSEDENECDTESPVTLYLSADDSNSMASPVLARRQILDGQKVTTAIRAYEFLNYYSFDYAPAPSEQLSVTAQMRMTEDIVAGQDQLYNLQIGVRSWDVAPSERRGVNLILSLDTSGSMGGEPIARVQDCCLAIAGSLKAGDVISLVDWNTSQNVILNSREVAGPHDAVLVAACNGLLASGGTNLHAGLVAAYGLAQANYSPDRINRVILMSDGGANVGITDKDLIAAHADDSEQEGIYLMGVGMGSASYFNEALMNTITEAGKGAYIYVDTTAEAQKMFGERFVSNIEVAARNVRVQLDLPPTFEMVVFHGEEWSTDPSEVEPQHLAPGDAMIYHQVMGSCDTGVLDASSPVTVTAHWEHRFTHAPMQTVLETTLGALQDGDTALLLKGDAITAYADALQALKNMNGQAAHDLIDATIAQVQHAKNSLAGDPDLVEIESLLSTYRQKF